MKGINKKILMFMLLMMFLNCVGPDYYKEYSITDSRIKIEVINDTLITITSNEGMVKFNPLKVKYIEWWEDSTWNKRKTIIHLQNGEQIWIDDNPHKTNFMKIMKIIKNRIGE